MLLALHCCVVTAGDTVPDDGDYGLRILHQKWPHMMIDVMDLFVVRYDVRAVITMEGTRSRHSDFGGRERLCECSCL